MNVVSIPAYVQRPRTAKPRRIVIHDPGQPTSRGVPVAVSAVGVAHFNATPPDQRHPPGVGGYHVTQDRTVTVVEAIDANRVNGAAQANEDGLHLCFADYDPASLAAGAAKCREWGATHGIPLVRRTAADWDQPGIIGHADIEIAIHATSPHTDPRGFPWNDFMALLAPAPSTPSGDNDVLCFPSTTKPANTFRGAIVDLAARTVTLATAAECNPSPALIPTNVAWESAYGGKGNFTVVVAPNHAEYHFTLP